MIFHLWISNFKILITFNAGEDVGRWALYIPNGV